MTTKSWESFCIVGAGRHAKNILIPALNENKQKISGLVTLKEHSDLGHIPIFKNLSAAIKHLPSNTLFLIASPPNIHYKQAKILAMQHRDFFIEKPLFLKTKQAEKITSLCQKQGTIIIEGYMYKHTKLYKKFITDWGKSNGKVNSVNAKFIIPRNPRNTYRGNHINPTITFFDIGCYIISLLYDLNIKINQKKFLNSFKISKKMDIISFEGHNNKMQINFQIGIGKTYQNIVSFTTDEGTQKTYWPFFYGREASKYISISKNKSLKTEAILDINAFAKMLKQKKTDALKKQKEEISRITSVTYALEFLNYQLTKNLNKLNAPGD
jgi:predicted dehydrogenase